MRVDDDLLQRSLLPRSLSWPRKTGSGSYEQHQPASDMLEQERHAFPPRSRLLCSSFRGRRASLAYLREIRLKRRATSVTCAEVTSTENLAGNENLGRILRKHNQRKT